MTFKQRSQEKELLDCPSNYTQEEYEDCLIKLDRIGRWLKGDDLNFKSLENLKPPLLSILDVGCGGGFFTTKMAKKYPQTQVCGIDLSSDAINFANKRISCLKESYSNLTFKICSVPLKEKSKSYDVLITTLTCHHMSDEELIDFLKEACRIAKRKVIINDLHRNPLAFYLFKFLSPLFFKNRLIQKDGPLSILRSFKTKEWKTFLEKGCGSPTHYRISWHKFRLIVEINLEEK